MAVHPSNINIWYQSLQPRKYAPAAICETGDSEEVLSLQPVQFLDNSHHGKVSKIAGKKITRSIDYLVYLAQDKRLPHTLKGKGLKFKINFVTLTLSSQQIHPDTEIKDKILDPFLDFCRRRWQVYSYIWRAEKQKNGSIHFHMITDRWIPWSELRDVWNRCQQKLGYVTRYRENQQLWHRDGFRYRPELAAKWPHAKQLKAWHEGCRHDWNSPNSTDVHSLRLINNVRAYFIKEMTKSTQAQNIAGRLWGSSANLVDLKGGRSFAEGRIFQELEKLMADKRTRSYSGDFFTAIYFDQEILKSGQYPELFELLEEYLQANFSMYRPPTLFSTAAA